MRTADPRSEASIEVQTVHVDDIDAFGEQIGMTDTQSVQLMQTERGRFRGSLTSFPLNRGILAIGTGTREYVSEGAFAPDTITLGVILEAPGPSLLNGMPAATGNFAIVEGGAGYIHHHAPHTSWLLLQIPREDLEALGVDRVPDKYCCFLRQRSSCFSLVRLVHSIATGIDRREARQPVIFNSERVYKDIISQMAYLLTERPIPMSLSRHDYLETAGMVTDFLQASRYEAIHVTDLCRMTGKSERTLERVCLRAFNIPPRSLIKLYRLHAVRRAMKTAPAERKTTVTELAMAFGFTHLGRFSAEYSKLFGELPSQTLANGPAHPA